jgi:acetylornithine/LysW-gamma-L-lysine aminotransferase
MSSPKEREERYGAAVFQKYPLTISRGKGALVWDDSGRQYIDFMTGYGVALVGHTNPAVVEAVKRQAEVLITCHGSFYNETRAELLEKLARAAPRGLESVLLTNSGTESVEGAIKLARRRTGRKKFVSMKGAFHGKTFGSLSATWNKKYREPFSPLLDGFEFADYGVPASLEALVDEDTAAVIAEPIQGESGILVPPVDYFKRVREICDSKGALLILDEIQTGLGRTGKMWCSEHWGVIPDIMTISKGLGGGLPIGAVIATPETMGALKRGEHSSTFAGNPLCCAAASATLDFIRVNDLPSEAERKGKLMKEGLARIGADHKIVREIRGKGLMLAMELRVDVHRLLLEALKQGVVFGYSGREAVRFLPPLVIQDGDISKGLEVLRGAVDEEEAIRLG